MKKKCVECAHPRPLTRECRLLPGTCDNMLACHLLPGVCMEVGWVLSTSCTLRKFLIYKGLDATYVKIQLVLSKIFGLQEYILKCKYLALTLTFSCMFAKLLGGLFLRPSFLLQHPALYKPKNTTMRKQVPLRRIKPIASINSLASRLCFSSKTRGQLHMCSQGQLHHQSIQLPQGVANC